MNWELICYLLENFSINKSRNLSFQKAEQVYLLEENSADEENTVYVTDGSHPVGAWKHALIIQVGKASIRCSNYLVLGSGSKEEILNTLLKALSHLAVLEGKLSFASTDQEVIDIASDYLGVPLFYFDASYRILAITKNILFENDPEWKHMTEKGFLSPESVRLMQESGDLDLLANKTEPFPYNASYYPFESLVCNIWNNDVFYSRLNMLCVSGSPNELQIEECRILCRCLLRIAVLSGNPLSYIGPLNSMVLDLLRGLQLSEELILDRLRTAPHFRQSLIQVCCIESNVKNDPQVLSYYSSLLNRIFEKDSVVVLEFDGNIVLILHATDPGSFHPLRDKLEELLLAQGLKCGVSSLFSRFSALHSYYKQALSTLSLGKKNQGINEFQEVYYDYILSFIPREQAMAMMSYEIRHLLQLQKGYQFPLAETLRTYLETNCNLQETAERLFIHKNTALYRLNHIKEIIHSDLEDADQRMEFLLSFRIAARYSLPDVRP